MSKYQSHTHSTMPTTQDGTRFNHSLTLETEPGSRLLPGVPVLNSAGTCRFLVKRRRIQFKLFEFGKDPFEGTNSRHTKHTFLPGSSTPFNPAVSFELGAHCSLCSTLIRLDRLLFLARLAMAKIGEKR